MKSFERWWSEEGSAILPTRDEDYEEFAKRVSQIAWSNGAYIFAKQPEPVPGAFNPGNFDAIATIATQPAAQPEQEPFGYLWPTGMHPEFRYTKQKRNGVDGMPLYTAAQPENGDIRALKYRIHELEGEVIGYKRMIEEAALKKLADLGQQIEQEPYPEGNVVGPCICGSWPGGKCLKCPRITPPAAQPAPVQLTDDELDVCRQWFNSVQDTNGGYLTGHDYALAEKLYLHLGLRVPDSVKQAAHGIKEGT